MRLIRLALILALFAFAVAEWRVVHRDVHASWRKRGATVSANFVVRVKRGWSWAADVAPFIVAIENTPGVACIVRSITTTKRRTHFALDCDDTTMTLADLRIVVLKALARAGDAAFLLVAPNRRYQNCTAAGARHPLARREVSGRE